MANCRAPGSEPCFAELAAPAEDDRDEGDRLPACDPLDAVEPGRLEDTAERPSGVLLGRLVDAVDLLDGVAPGRPDDTLDRLGGA